MSDININNVYTTATQEPDGSDSTSDLVLNPPSTSHPTWPTISTPDFNIRPYTLEPKLPTGSDQESFIKFIEEFFEGKSDEQQIKELEKTDLKDYDQEGVIAGHVLMIMKKSFGSLFAVVLILSDSMTVLKPDETFMQISKLEDINEDGVYMVLEWKDGFGHATAYFKHGDVRDRFDPQKFQNTFTCIFHSIHYLKQRRNGHCHDTIMEKYTSDNYENDKMVFNDFKQSIPLKI